MSRTYSHRKKAKWGHLNSWDRYWKYERKQVLTEKFYNKQTDSLLKWGDEYAEEERTDLSRSTKKPGGYLGVNYTDEFNWSWNPEHKSNITDFYHVIGESGAPPIVPDECVGRGTMSETEARKMYPKIWNCVHKFKDDICEKCGMVRILKK